MYNKWQNNKVSENKLNYNTGDWHDTKDLFMILEAKKCTNLLCLFKYVYLKTSLYIDDIQQHKIYVTVLYD